MVRTSVCTPNKIALYSAVISLSVTMASALQAQKAQTSQLSALAPSIDKPASGRVPATAPGTVSATQLNAAIPRYLSVGNPGSGDVVQRAVSLKRTLRDQKKVTSSDPGQWTRDALLSGDSESLDKRGLRVAAGYLSGDLSKVLNRQEIRQVGGAIIIEGQSNDGKLFIELIGFQRDTTYLTGLIVEPLKQVSDIIFSRPALNKQISLQSRLSLEAKVLAAAAEAVDGIEPEAGQTLEEDKSATSN